MFRSLPVGVLFALALAVPAHAQQMGAEPLTISLSPQYPRPYQTVTVTPQSTAFDLTGSSITVTANGTVVHTGTGAERTNVTVGGPGSATTIVVRAVHDGQTYTKQVVVRPADVALIIEPAGTAHPFYRGGVALSSEGRLRIVAMPDIRTSAGTRLSPDNLVYTWRLGEQILEAQSGIGKSTLTATAPVRYRDTTITLTVTSPDSAYVAQARTVVSPSDPFVHIYRSDPLLGPLFDTALSGTIAMNGEEQTFRAVPYFFASAPALTWSVNGSASGGEKDITLRSTGSGAGSASLTASARQAATFQVADTRLTIRFGSGGGLGIFGL